tara:strand:+ start:1406 stop:3907 length:2502 start_codon:yes stop_codon:yes gene_type:complete
MLKTKFPLIFGRKGGEKFDILSSLSTPITQNNLVGLLEKLQQIKNFKDVLINDLYSIIDLENDLKTRKKLLNFKRDFFNNRSLEKYDLTIKEYILFCEKLELYSQKKKNYKKELEVYKEVFNQEFFSSIEQLKKITDTYFFKNGMLFSSHILSREISKTDFKFSTINKNKKRLLISVLKYLSRSLTKTTPFSSFNSVFCLEGRSNHFAPIINDIKTSSFQITNLFFHFLKEILIQNKGFKNHLNINCNTTIWEDKENSDEFHLFINNSNHETFKKLQKSPILIYIKSKLLSNNLVHNELVTELKTITEETEKTIDLFINNLIDEGFLNIEYPVSSDNKNWIEELLSFILKHTQLYKKEGGLISLLKSIQKTIFDLENSINVNERAKLIKESYEGILTYFHLLDNKTNFSNKVKPQDLFYEDTFSKCDNIVSVKIINNASEALKEVFFSLNNIKYKEAFKKSLGNHLQEKYNGKLPILLFYEKIYLKYSKKFMLSESDLNIFKKSFQKIAKDINENESLGAIDLSKYIKPNRNCDTPFGAYIQVSNQNWDQIVVNSFSNGNGSNISRFLNFLPKEYSEEVLEYNKDRHKNKILTEVKDASIHNVNAYPPLSNYVINIMGDNALKKNYHCINLLNIYAVSDPKRGIVLKNEKGVEIQPNSFSLEGLNRKSKFTQFLDIFNPVDILGCTMYIQNINQLFINKLKYKELIHIPRIIYKEEVIIQREKWIVKKEFLKKLLNKVTQSLDENYIIINQWILQNKIPLKVFVKIAQRDLTNSQNDNYKPQYINFESPVFILLFLSMIEKSDSIVEISEMYPNVSQINQTGGYAKEYVLNIN